MSLKHLVGIDALSPAQVDQILDLAAQVKDKPGEYRSALQGQTLAMIFLKPSTRTRVSFETGIYQLGGQGIFLSGQDIQIGRGETVADTARVLSRYVDGIMARVFAHSQVADLAEYATVPVINGLSDYSHPCQALADLQTMREITGGDLAGRKLAYVGDATNVYLSLLFAGMKSGMHVSIGAPAQYQPAPAVVAQAREHAVGDLETLVTDDPKAAVADADFIYADVFASMGQEGEREERLKVLAPYAVTADLMAAAKPDCKFLHCLPAHRGEEVTAEVIDGPASVVWDQAENRLHAQKAIMLLLMGGTQ